MFLRERSMRTKPDSASLVMLLCLGVAAFLTGEQVSRGQEHKPTPPWLGEDTKKRALKVLNEFNNLHKDHDAEEVRQVMNTIRASEGSMAVSPHTRLQLIRWLKLYRDGKDAYVLSTGRILVDLGDTEEIESAMVKLHSPKWHERFEAMRCIGSTTQPLVIRALEKDLFTEDELETVRLGAEFVFDAPSEFATNLITEVLVASPAFSDDVKNWAKDLPSLKTRKHRELIRLWWKHNKQFFETMSYDRVTPLSPEKYTLTPEDYKPKRSPIRKVQ
jgi:hypothetical protein